VQTRQKWTPEQQQLFKYKTAEGEVAGEGTGRGEYAVASVLTGLGTLDQVKNLISGGSKSYDVSWPSKDKPTYKFEVKELNRANEDTKNKDVRIGTEGDPLGREVISTITNVLKAILEEYNDLPSEEKKQIDQEIITYSLETKLPPEPELKQGGKERAGSIAKRQKFEAYKGQIAAWTLSGYINAVLEKSSELGAALLFSDTELQTANFGPERKKYCLISIKRLFQSIEEIEHILRDENTVDETNPRVIALRNVLRTNYAADGETEEVETLKAYLDSEAEKIDKKLLKVKCKATGEGCVVGKTFYKDLMHLNLLQTINSLQQKLYSPETIRSLFPKDLTGFFAVNPEGFLYAPINKVGELVTFHSISLGRPKIRLK
jgi:hypothetical protein